MKARTVSVFCGVFGAFLAILAARSASAGSQSGGLIRLQPVTPGVVQSGHLNISGTVIADRFKGNGSQLTNLPPLQLPYLGFGNSTGGLFLVENENVGAAVLGYSSNTVGDGVGVEGLADGPSASGVVGRSGDATSGRGGYFEAFGTLGVGVYGRAAAPAGFNEGGYFESESTSGAGVRGTALASTGVTYGGYFETLSQSGRAVFGVATANTLATTGGRFEAGGIGAMGRALATSGLSYGVFGVSVSPDGTGVFGTASSTSGFSRGGRFEVASA
ncbi:MAG TPA: hypothetical protein PKA27_03385, partial [Fimbriimonadaceae bacterium]|nr:hypothetical protein [Fimbriimonadaceae bacterium]